MGLGTLNRGTTGGRKASRPQPQRRGGELREQIQRYELQLQQQNAQAPANTDGSAAIDEEQLGGSWFGRDPEPGTEAIAQTESPDDVGLASLDVALAERGVEYLFTTPRGDVDITARAITTERVNHLLWVLGIVGSLILLAVMARAVQYLNQQLSRNVRGTILIVAGGASLIGIFPIAGLVAIGCGIWLLTRPRRGLMISGV